MMRARRMMRVPKMAVKTPSKLVTRLHRHDLNDDDSFLDITLQSKTSVADNLPSLSQEEKAFFELVRAGQVNAVEGFLQHHPHFNINCQNYEGYTALVTSIKQEDAAMVECLLQYDNILTGDAFLHAVATGSFEIVRRIAHYEEDNKDRLAQGENIASADFSSDMTPLILAAQQEHYDIIEFLIKKGGTIEIPHRPDCFCKEKCSHREIKGEPLEDSVARLNVYEAISSPAYICQSSSDPIYTAFMLSEELQEISEIEREFKKEYIKLAENCSQFAVDLLDQTRTNEEVERVLNRKEGNERSKSNPNWRYTRVGLAIELQEKKFVAHENTQQLLRTAWLEGWQDWKKLHFVTKVLRLFPRTVLLPIMALVYLIVPKTKFVQTWRTPLNKFFSFASSYIIFLIFILIQNHKDSFRPDRGPPNTGYEGFIALYIIGMTWRQIKIMLTYGLKWYFTQKWNIFDCITVACFDLSVVFWTWSYFDVKKNGNKSMPRDLWSPLDPTIIAELFYAVAVIFAFIKVFYFFQIGQALGPLLTSLSQMLRDIVHFITLFVVTMISFSIGLFQIYHHYNDNVRVDPDGRLTYQQRAFNSIPRALDTLYWSMYGYSPPTYAEVVVPNSHEIRNNKTITVVHRHLLTESVGYSIFIIYYVTGVIILINLLIAMMSTSYSTVDLNRDTQWKFSRAKVWMMFMQPGQTLPPPFNLLPSPKTALRIVCWLKAKLTRSGAALCNISRGCYLEQPEKYRDLDDDEAYQALMAKLVQRYITDRNKRHDKGSKSTLEVVQKHLTHITHDIRKLKRVSGVQSNETLMSVAGGGRAHSRARMQALSSIAEMDSQNNTEYAQDGMAHSTPHPGPAPPDPLLAYPGSGFIEQRRGSNTRGDSPQQISMINPQEESAFQDSLQDFMNQLGSENTTLSSHATHHGGHTSHNSGHVRHSRHTSHGGNNSRGANTTYDGYTTHQSGHTTLGSGRTTQSFRSENSQPHNNTGAL